MTRGRTRARIALSLVTALGAVGCATRTTRAPDPIPSAPSSLVVGSVRPPGPEPPEPSTAPPDVAAPSAAPKEAPRPAREGEQPLAVPGYDPALVSFPPSTASPLPLLFVAHGAKDLPSAQCRVFRAALGPRGTVVCLAGPKADVHAEPRYFPDHPTLEKILEATKTAYFSAFENAGTRENGRKVPAIYVGYSQGATMGALLLPAHAGEFQKLLLVEGGFSEWTSARAEEFVHGGGARVAFVCGTKKCAEGAPGSAHLLQRAGAETRVFQDLRSGHDYGPRLVVKIEEAVRWLTLPTAR